MTPSGKAILKCPSCDKSLVNIASKVERVHPVARFIEENYFRVLLGWGLFTPVALILIGGMDRGIGFGAMGLMAIPVFGMYFLKRAYPLYRVTRCPYCGYHEKLKLGRSAIG